MLNIMIDNLINNLPYVALSIVIYTVVKGLVKFHSWLTSKFSTPNG